ncbi:copper homeostasis protein CutC [Curtobacterium sp. 24E2]
MTPSPVALEIAVTSPQGAVVARDGGADRVELCVGLELGG